MSPERLLTRPFVFCSLANFFQGLAFFLFIHFPGYLAGFGADEVEIGFIIGVAAVVSILIRPSIGALMDMHGRRPVILAGNVANIVVLLLYLTVNGLGPWVYIVRIGHGLAVATLFTSLFTYGADVVPRSRLTEGLALFGVSGLLPIALAGIVGDVVLAISDFDGLFITALVLAMAALAFSLPLRDQVALAPLAERRAGFLQAAKSPELAPLWWITGIFALVLTGYFTFLKTFVLETSIGSVGLFFGFYAGTAILLRVSVGWLPERIGHKRVLYPAAAALAAGFVVIAGASTATEVALTGILCGVGHGFMFPIIYGFVVVRAPAADRGTALAIFTSLFDVGTLVGSPLLGLVISVAGYPAMFLSAGALTVFGAAVYAWWDHAGVTVPVPAEA